MRTYRRTVVAEASPDQVWAYLADFTTTNDWDPRAHRTRRLSGDGDVGTEYETHVRFLGRETRMLYKTTRLEPHRRIEWVGHNGTVRACDVIEVWPHPEGTVVDYTTSYAYRHLPWLMDRLMSRPIDRLCDEAQVGLARTLSERSNAS